MLACRLPTEEEERVVRFARAHGRGKSDVVRAALAEYLDRHEGEDDFVRQIKAVAALERGSAERQAELGEVDALAWRMTEALD